VIAEYDSRTSDDPIWGLGLGCEGLMRIALLRLEAAGGYAPLSFMLDCERRRTSGAYAMALHSTLPGIAAGKTWQYEIGAGDAASGSTDAAVLDLCRGRSASGGAATTRLELADGGIEVFCAAIERAPAILLCGAGPDAEPLVAIGTQLGWQFTLVDHRPAYLERGRFDAPGVELVQVEPENLGSAVELARFDAAVVMSHHLVADGKYLAALASSNLGYVGLLGPAARRERLFAEIGPAQAGLLRTRLRAPVGLDLGGRTPEAIALSIVAEIQAALNGRRGLPFSEQAAAAASA
jgi:xanthine/CO dehydrogenase XdhC/CoxF family maturation factor